MNLHEAITGLEGFHKDIQEYKKILPEAVGYDREFHFESVPGVA